MHLIKSQSRLKKKKESMSKRTGKITKVGGAFNIYVWVTDRSSKPKKKKKRTSEQHN